MNVLLQDLRYAVRMVVKNPGFTIAVVITLALAIGMNTAMFSLVNRVLFAPLPFEDADRLVRVFRVSPEGEDSIVFSYPDYQEYRDRCDVFEHLVAHANAPISMETSEGSESRFGQMVSGNYFTAFGVKALHGRMLSPEDDRTPGAHPVVVLSYRYWQRQMGGDPDIVGQPITISGSPYTVVGVAPRGFTGSMPIPTPDLWFPMMMFEEIRRSEAGVLDNRDNGFLLVVGKLKPGLNLEKAQANLDLAASQMIEVDQERYEDEAAILMPADGIIPMTPGIRKTALAVSLLVLFMVGLVLIVGCANVANLLLARSITRSREIAVRLAIGASRPRIIRQLLTESIVLALLGGAAGLLLSVWTLDAIIAAIPDLPYNIALELEFGLDGRVLLFTAVVSILTGVLFGLLPALGTTRVELTAALKDDHGVGRFGFKRSRVRNTLVVAQVAASMVLLIVAGLFLRSLLKANAIDPGFEHANVLIAVFDVDALDSETDQTTLFYEQLLARVRALPGVEAATIMNVVPLTMAASSTDFWVEGRTYSDPEDEQVNIAYSTVSSDTFETLGIPLLRGRDFSAGDTADSPKVTVVNQALADRYWPGENPIGKRLSPEGADGPYLEVIGVAATSKYWLVGEEPRPYLFRPMSQQPIDFMATILVRTTGDPLVAAVPVRSVFREIDPDVSLSTVGSLTELISFVLLPARFAAAGFGLFGLLALLLASVGLYGVMAYAVSQRTREIGIRIALGADRKDIIRQTLTQGIRLTVIGLVIGLAVSIAGTRLLSNLLYGIGATDPFTFIGVSLLLAAVALLACFIPARRATMIDPVDALRSE